MQHDNLVRMANQIGKFFAVQGHDRAVVGIAEHIRKFWEPRMKQEIFAHVEQGGAGLDPLVLEALQKLHERYVATGAWTLSTPATAPDARPPAKSNNGKNGKSAAK